MSQVKSLFPHMVVGNTKKASTDFVASYMIPYGLSSAISTRLATEKTAGSSHETIKDVANTFLTDGSSVFTKSEVQSMLPDFDSVVEQLHAYNGTGEAPAPADTTNLNSAISRLWDSAFILYITNSDAPLLQDITNAIKIQKLVEARTTGDDLVNFWKKGKLLFPTNAFPIPKKVAESGLAATPAPASETAALERIEAIESAREEIFGKYSQQVQTLKKSKITSEEFRSEKQRSAGEDQEGIPAANPTLDIDSAYDAYLNEVDGEEIDAAAVSAMSSGTQETLTTYGLGT